MRKTKAKHAKSTTNTTKTIDRRSGDTYSIHLSANGTHHTESLTNMIIQLVHVDGVGKSNYSRYIC